MNDKTLALTYIIGTYPGQTTTFIDREVVALRRMGVELKILSIRRPWNQLSPQQQDLSKDVIYLMPFRWLAFFLSLLYYAVKSPRRFFSTLTYLLTRPHPTQRARAKTFFHFLEGVYAAYVLRRDPGQHLHAHFIDRAATVALVVSRMLDIPYSVTAHATDIYVNPMLLHEKLSGAKFVSTCTGYNRSYLSHLSGERINDKLLTIYHGLEKDCYVRTQRVEARPPVILAVGQLKEKKGLRYLVDACSLLRDRGITFTCRIVGDGPLRAALAVQINRLGLDDYVKLLGALPHNEVIAEYQQATVFALPAVLGSDGDRDGIPNVILEALAMELPVVSTNHSGVPEAVEDGVNGILVPPQDSHALADALERLIQNREMRQEFGMAGRRIVAEHFDPDKNASRLLEAFAA